MLILSKLGMGTSCCLNINIKLGVAYCLLVSSAVVWLVGWLDGWMDGWIDVSYLCVLMLTMILF